MQEDRPKRVKVSPESDIAVLLEGAKASGGLLIVDTGRDEYSIYVEDDHVADDAKRIPGATEEVKKALWQGYDPEKIRSVLNELAGSIPEEEAAALIDYIYTARREGSRPADKI